MKKTILVLWSRLCKLNASPLTFKLNFYINLH